MFDHDKINIMSVTAEPGLSEPGIDQLKTLYRLLTSLSQARALEDVYEAALTSLLEATAADRAAILLFDMDGVIRFKASRGLSNDYQEAVTGHCPWPAGTKDAHPLVIPDVLLDNSMASYHEALRREGIGALVFVPLALEAGVFGKFMLYYRAPHHCPDGELAIAQAIAAHVALATERKRAELAHLRSEQRLQAILDNSATVIFLKDLHGRYQMVNRCWEQQFQIPRAEVLGRTDRDIFPVEVADRFRANDQVVLATLEPLTVEEIAPQHDGIHTYLSIKFPLLGHGGQATGVCGMATDITQRKHLEAAGRLLAAIVESSDDAIISKDLNGIITSWNQSAERTFGYSSNEAIGQPVSILAAPGHQDEMPRILAKIRQGERVEHFETRRRSKDGRIIEVSLTVSPVRDASGEIVGASKIARDITERKHMEQERLLLLAREREARRTAELLNRLSPRLTAQLDLEKLVQAVTDIATALAGADFGAFFHSAAGELEGSYRLYSLSGLLPEAFTGMSVPRDTDLLGRTFRGEGVVRCDDVTLDPRYARDLPDGGIPHGPRPVRSYLAVPVVTRSGEVLGGLLFGHSEAGKFTANHESIITGIAAQAAIAIDNARLFEQAQWAQAELKRSNEELRRTNQDLEVFAYSASHDLQEPLRTIAISAQLIERSLGPQLDGQNATFLSNMITAAKRMSALIEDLLTYTKATKYEEGTPPTIDSRSVLETALESMDARIQETGASVTFAELPRVAIHETRLIQLFQNIIGNAIKYCGGQKPHVHVTAETQHGWCVFSIADNGIGIDPEFAEQIFGLFKRLHRDAYPGSGIGLAICQRVVEQYGGRIWLARSAPGEGSTFCFSVPAGQ